MNEFTPLRGTAPPTAAGPDELVVCSQPLPGMNQECFDRALDEIGCQQPSSTKRRNPQLTVAARRRQQVVALRHYLTGEVGEGYWDFFRLNENLVVSITSATYRRDQWVPVDGARHFRIRLLLSGSLIDAAGETLLQGPQGQIYVTTDHSDQGYFIAKDQETKFVALQFRGALLPDILGLDRDATPPPFDRLFDAEGGSVLAPLNLGPDLVRAAQRMIESRHEIPHQLRAPLIEALGMEVLCQVLGDYGNRDLISRSSSNLSARDLNRIYEARDYLGDHFASPPKIPHLARLVGVNQTKLKAGFKQAFGMTIYEYVLQRRMECASQLLMANDFSVAEVAYQVGYEYPANFTCAFKKHFGRLPRSWKRRRGTSQAGSSDVGPGTE